MSTTLIATAYVKLRIHGFYPLADIGLKCSAEHIKYKSKNDNAGENQGPPDPPSCSQEL